MTSVQSRQGNQRPQVMIALALLISLQIATPAWAWGRLGHRVIARIAEKSLTPQS
jgi:hypothetical protein